MTAKQVAHDGHSGETSLAVLIERHLELLQSRNYAPTTLRLRSTCLSIFARWCESEGLPDVGRIAADDLERYSMYLRSHRTQKGELLSAQTRSGYLIALRVFFSYLTRSGLLLSDPARRLVLPMELTLPKALDAVTVERVLSLPDVDSSSGLRDRAMLEMLYSTGLRRSELVRLCLSDVNAPAGTVFVRCGKGGRDRMIPLGERAILWLERYLRECRPSFLAGSDDGVLFLTRHGRGFTAGSLGDRLSRYFHEAGVSRGSCHLLRHTAATLMMENGADLRYVQEFLGHANPQTTQIYTKVNLSHLREVHERTHPSCRSKEHGRQNGRGNGKEKIGVRYRNRPRIVRTTRRQRSAGAGAAVSGSASSPVDSPSDSLTGEMSDMLPGALPSPFADFLQSHLSWMKVSGYRPAAMYNRRRYVTEFIRFCERNDIDSFTGVTTSVLERYQKDLAGRKSKALREGGKPSSLSIHTQYAMLSHVCMFFRYLKEKGYVLLDPSDAFVLPSRPKGLPRSILTAIEVERILACPDTETPCGLRDRAMLEVLYATGLRRGELVQLRLGDYRAANGSLLIRAGKTGRERLVPVGRRCALWLERYLDEARSLFESAGGGSDALFLTSQGGPFYVDISGLVRKYMRAAGVDRPSAVHIFRHTAATLMMENGADLRSVQELLGHERISSTAVYTRVSIRRLRDVHGQTHPAEILLRERRDRQKDRQSKATPEKQRQTQKKRQNP